MSKPECEIILRPLEDVESLLEMERSKKERLLDRVSGAINMLEAREDERVEAASGENVNANKVMNNIISLIKQEFIATHFR